MNYKLRRQRLKKKLRRNKIDALLVSQPENRRYLSGYCSQDHTISESSGFLYIPARGKSLLLTDFRFKLQAEKEADLPVRLYTKGMVSLLKQLISASAIKRFGFESRYTLHSLSVEFNKIAKKKKIEFVPLSDLVESMRVVKSEKEIDLIRTSVRLNEKVFKKIFKHLSPEMREIDVAIELETAMRRAGAGRDEIGPEVKRLREQNRIKIMRILTPEQQEKFKKWRSARIASPLTPGRVWVLGAGGKPEPVAVVAGISDGSFTEIVRGDLEPGQQVILGTAQTSGRKKGGGRRFGF